MRGNERELQEREYGNARLILMIENPWLELPNEAPFVLDCDQASIAAAQAKCNAKGTEFKQRYGYQTQLMPDPFTGNPFNASVIILTANPGYADDAKAAEWAKRGCTGSDDEWHAKSKYLQDCYRKNLRHEAQPYSHFFLSPELAGTPGGCYARSQLREPIERFGLQRVANAICILEYFPYHSRDFRDFGPIPSQTYSFALIDQAIEREACIVVLRAERKFIKAVPKLAMFPYLRKSSARSGSVSSRNILGFERLSEAIKNSP